MSSTTSNNKLILYGNTYSPCVRAVLLVAEAINLKLNYKEINLVNCEHLTKEYLKKNPVHTVPVLEIENGGYIIDSHAIITYLITMYAKNSDLYSNEPFKRAMIDQRLHFDSGILYIRLRNVSMGIYTENDVVEIPEVRIKNVYEGFDFVECFLNETEYLAGNKLTVADLCCVCTIASCQGFAPITENRYPKLTAWMNKITKLPYYEIGNGIENERYVNFLKDLIEKKRSGQKLNLIKD